MLTLYTDGLLPLWPVIFYWPYTPTGHFLSGPSSGPSSFSDPIRRRVAFCLAHRLARHLLVRPKADVCPISWFYQRVFLRVGLQHLSIYCSFNWWCLNLAETRHESGFMEQHLCHPCVLENPSLITNIASLAVATTQNNFVSSANIRMYHTMFFIKIQILIRNMLTLHFAVARPWGCLCLSRKVSQNWL